MFRTAASLVLVTLLFSCTSPDEQKTDAPAYAALSDTVRYVGMQTCRNCHADIYESFLKTGMGNRSMLPVGRSHRRVFRITRRSSIVIVTCITFHTGKVIRCTCWSSACPGRIPFTVGMRVSISS